MKSNTFFKLFIIILIGLIFRLTCLDKLEGLWNDEYVSWYIATQYNFEELIKAIFQNCHMPLYYLYIKFWLLFAPDTDLSLRYSSIIPSIFSIIMMYFCGKEISNKKVGLCAAGLTAISSFCIYFAQEVRLYSLVFLFTSVVVFYFIKAINTPNQKNISLFFISQILLCATHTLAIIFAFFNIIIFLYLLFSKENKQIKIANFIKSKIKYLIPFTIGICALFPLMQTIAFSNNLSQFWSTFTVSKIFFVFSDYFSPTQINIINTPTNLFDYLIIKNQINYSFLIFCITPTILGGYLVYKAYKMNDTILKNLLITSLLYLLCIVSFAIAGKLVLITKYTIEIYPILIVSIAFCFNKINENKFLKYIFMALIIINLSYLIFAPNSAPKLERSEGNRAVVELINYSRLKENDVILLTYYDKDKFIRYSKLEDKFIVKSINKFNFNNVLFDEINYFEVIKNGKTKYKHKFEEYPNKDVLEYVDKEISPYIKSGDKVGIVFLNNVSFFSNENIKSILKDEKKYKNTSFIFLVFSSLRNNLLYKFRQDYTLDSTTTAGDWSLFVFEKK